MLEQTGNALKFYAHFVESKVGKTGLTVTVDVYRNGVEIVTAGSATEVGDGLYSYELASGSNNAEGEYICVFKTATTSVDQQHIPALWVVNKAGVEYLDASINALPTAAEVNAEVVDVLRTDTIPDSYASDGSQPTMAQALLAIHQFLTEKSVTGTTLTVKKPDGSTAAMTFTLNDASNPSSITRAS